MLWQSLLFLLQEQSMNGIFPTVFVGQTRQYQIKLSSKVSGRSNEDPQGRDVLVFKAMKDLVLLYFLRSEKKRIDFDHIFPKNYLS